MKNEFHFENPFSEPATHTVVFSIMPNKRAYRFSVDVPLSVSNKGEAFDVLAKNYLKYSPQQSIIGGSFFSSSRSIIMDAVSHIDCTVEDARVSKRTTIIKIIEK